ncbi:formylglycine-generating enzyme family protein [Thermodesulfobacteriota bacterium]
MKAKRTCYPLLAVSVLILLICPIGGKAQATKHSSDLLSFSLDGVSFRMVRVSAGSFVMGNPSNEPKRSYEESQHKVTLTQDFYLGETEVTQGLWRAVMGNNPSLFKYCGDDCPVERVSWEDCQKFIRKLNQMTGKQFRLPTEAEWEYACRAGTTTPFHAGKCLGAVQANYRGNFPMPGCGKGPNRGKTMPVASFKPNAWGLYDMHGNVWEWCQDWYGDYPDVPVADPVGPSSGLYRIRRGGSWFDFARDCRSAHRRWFTPDTRYDILGFRLALSDQ